jgi:Peptidase MA superfamily
VLDSVLPLGLVVPANSFFSLRRLAREHVTLRLFQRGGRAILLALAFFAMSSAAFARSDSGRPVYRSDDIPAEFSTLESGFLSIHYPRELGSRARQLAQAGAPFKKELADLLGRPGGLPFLARVEVRLGRTPLEMEKLAPPGVRFPKYAAGVAVPSAHLVLLSDRPRYPGERHELVEIFKHELAHVALHDRLQGQAAPRWFDEGFAVFASGEAEVSRMQAMWSATLAKKLIPLGALDRRFPEDASTASVAYAQAADIVRFLQRGDGLPRFRAIFSRIDKGESFSQALTDAYGTDLFSLETEWLEDAARRYTFWPILLSSSTIWVVAMALFGVAYVRRRSQAKEKMRVWAVEEAREDAERERLAREIAQIRVVLAHPEVLAKVTSPTDIQKVTGHFRGVPFVEHDGTRHTLH